MLRWDARDLTMNTSAVLVEDVHVRFGGVHALAGIDLAAPAGSTLAVLGHNGAGKTTLIRVLTTLVRPDAGRVLVDGFDAVADPDQVRRRIGVTGQYAGLDEYLTGRENLELVGRLGGLGTRARARAEALIDRLVLDDIAERRVGELSGGSRRRIDLAASLVGEPHVLFLDEPTTGLDPAAADRTVGARRRTHRRRHHRGPHHPVPRRGGSARRRHRCARPWPDLGPRDARGAETARRRQGRHGHDRHRRSATARSAPSRGARR